MPRLAYQEGDVWHLPLTQGMCAVVEAEDAAYLQQWNWCYYRPRSGYTGYGKRSQRMGTRVLTILLHHVIAERMGMLRVGELEIDHIDHNGLNNLHSLG